LDLASGEQEMRRRALEALAAGGIDYYRAERKVTDETGAERLLTYWVRAVTVDHQRMAFVQAAPADGNDASPLSRYLRRSLDTMAIAVADRSWTVSAVSSDIRALLGIEPDEVKGHLFLGLVAESDVSRLLEADAHAGPGATVALRVRFRRADGSWRQMCCVQSRMAGGMDRCFILIPEVEAPPSAPNDRAALLEWHMMKIAEEVAASGVLAGIAGLQGTSHLPELQHLSSRQWDVLRRLKRGERVPTIAKELYLSQSTVRNHLAAIFEHFGVHSQAELLAALAGKDELPG
jgi:DNA-binding CsgD family transcriptional regulator/PAS domain-containing protein